MSRVRVKICGLTTEEDARHAIEAGADALGFNTWQGSKRYLDLEKAAGWLAHLAPFVTKVALLVNAPLEEAVRVARLPFIDAVQLHGDEDPAFVQALSQRAGRPVIKALRVRTAADLAQAAAFATPFFLLDAQVEGHFGGTGVSIDPALIHEFRRQFPRSSPILAGGLRAENVGAAVRAARPFAVDVSSGVETMAGRKNPQLVQDFIAALRAAESQG